MSRWALGPEIGERGPSTWIGLGPRSRHAAAVAGAVLAVCAGVLTGGLERLRGWVHDRPAYRWTVDDVQLDPPPPPWIRGGREKLLDLAAPTLSASEGRSALELDLEAVERAFKNVFWVERVRRVRLDYPARLTVSVDYRRPVAIARLGSAGVGQATYPVDRNGVLLPTDERLDRDGIGEPGLLPLVDFDPPAVDSPGMAWSQPPGDGSPAEPDRAVAAASALAGFVLERVEDEGWPTGVDGRPWALHQIRARRDRRTGRLIPGELFLRHSGRESGGEGLRWVFWGPAPGEEPAGEPTAEQKWRRLVESVGLGEPDRAGPGAYLDMTRPGTPWTAPPAPPAR